MEERALSKPLKDDLLKKEELSKYSLKKKMKL